MNDYWLDLGESQYASSLLVMPKCKIGMMEKTNVDRLLTDIRAGKKDAFDRFLSFVQGTVLSFGMKVCGEVEDARDTMQDTLLTAFRSLRGMEMKDAAALKVWLYKVAKNACLMRRRKGKFAPKTILSLDELLPHDLHASDESNLPVNLLVKKETILSVREAIQALPVPYRLVLVLRDMEQLSAKQTAEILGLSEATVKIRLHRARLFIKMELEKRISRKKK